MAEIGGEGGHEGFATRLLGELNGYLRSRFVSQKFVAYIAQFNKADMSVLADLLQNAIGRATWRHDISHRRYDIIYDLVGNHSFSERRRILGPNGICVMAGIGGAGWHEGFATRLLGELNGYLRSRFVSQKFVAYIAQFNKADMSVLADLLQT